MYQQIITPNISFPYVGGLCEGFVEGSYGQASAPYKLPNGNWTTSGVWPSATAAWNTNFGNGNSSSLPPKGVYVPVYFELGSTSYGHVAIHMPDGRVISSSLPGYNKSGYIYKNLDAMILDYANNNKYCSYLGWSQYVGRAQVVKKEVTVNTDLGQARHMKFAYEGANGFYGKNALEGAYDEELSKYVVGKPLDSALKDFYESNTAKEYREKWFPSKMSELARIPALEKEIAELKKQLNEKSEYVKISDLYIKKG